MNTEKITEAVRDTIIILAIIAAIAGACYGVVKAVIESDRNDCLGWQKDAKQYPLFYITSWQKQQCDYFGIDIDAPVATSTAN